MTNNTDKDNWINEVMESTQGMSPAAPSMELFEKISVKVAGFQTIKTTPLPLKQWVAAAILLLALNIGSVVYFNNQSKKSLAAGINPFSADIQSISTYNY